MSECNTLGGTLPLLDSAKDLAFLENYINDIERLAYLGARFMGNLSSHRKLTWIDGINFNLIDKLKRRNVERVRLSSIFPDAILVSTTPNRKMNFHV